MPELTALQQARVDMIAYIRRASDEGHTRAQVGVQMLDFGARTVRAAAIEIVEAFEAEFPEGSDSAKLLGGVKAALGLLSAPSASPTFAELWK